jgi:2-polyprenyl-6-methoxyphenol hydroxylase-like FAD-dependent oxidoreductase
LRGRALVIGGSVAGLFAAHLLRGAGWDVAVFERSQEDLAGRGAGIGTRADLFAILRRIGITLDPSAGVRVKSRLCLDKSGAVIARHVVPAVNSAWDRIYRPLKDAWPKACYRAGARLERLEQGAGTVTAFFADGNRAGGDLLIGADGAYSTVRQIVLPGVEPRYAGYVAWRGVVEERDLPAATRAEIFEHFTFCLPPGELIIALPMPGRDTETETGSRRFHWVWFRAVDYERGLPLLCTDESGHCHGVTIPPPLIRKEVVAELIAHAREVLAPQLAALVARTPQPILQPIYDLEAPRLVVGRVALVGDAAFLARPHVGTGVTKAARDGEVLADSLAAASDIDAGLQAYDCARRAFGSALVARARALGAYLEPGPRKELPDPATLIAEYGAAGTLAEEVYSPSPARSVGEEIMPRGASRSGA